MPSPSLAQALSDAQDYLQYVMRTTAQNVNKPTLSQSDVDLRTAALTAFRAAKTACLLSRGEAEANVGQGRRVGGCATDAFTPSNAVTGLVGFVGA